LKTPVDATSLDRFAEIRPSMAFDWLLCAAGTRNFMVGRIY